MLSDQFRNIPAPFGSRAVPEGHVRVNHYTSEDSIESIRSNGLSMKHAHESFARGGTEYPSIFATAGPPTEGLMRARPVVEAHFDANDLDIGRGTPPAELESRRSVVTTNKDVPAKNIMAIHEPWHQTFRYIQNSPEMESDIMGGMYDNSGDKDTDRAVNMTKVALAGKVMLGGKLGSRGPKK